MMLALLFVATALAGDLAPRPDRPAPTEGECSSSIPLRVGERPPVELVDPDTGLVRCGAVAEPTSSLAYLLAVEKHRDAIEKLWTIDVKAAHTERDFYRDRYLDAANPPWHRTPSAYRWTGRIEALAAVVLAAVIISGDQDG